MSGPVAGTTPDAIAAAAEAVADACHLHGPRTRTQLRRAVASVGAPVLFTDNIIGLALAFGTIIPTGADRYAAVTPDAAA